MLPALLLLPGCIEELDQETSTIGDVERDCIVPMPVGVTGMGAPVSLEYEGGSLWIWEAMDLAAGGTVLTPSAFVTSAARVCDEGPLLARDEVGAPTELIALSDEESADNATRADGRSLRLVPHGGFVYEGRGYLFYDHVLVGPGVFDVEEQGAGLCVVEEESLTCERIVLDGTTILWGPDAVPMNRGGLVVGDRALVYGCRRYASFAAYCVVSGAPLDALTNPNAYQVFNAFDGWVDDPLQATVIAEELGEMTVRPFTDGYMAITLDPFAPVVHSRRSQGATDEFERSLELFDIAPASSWFVSGGREHYALHTGEFDLNVTYFTNNTERPGLHLVTYAFHGNDWGDPYQ